MNDRESDYDWYREGQPVGELVQEITGASDGLTGDLMNYLLSSHGGGDPYDTPENPYDNDACYEEASFSAFNQYQDSWNIFRREIARRDGTRVRLPLENLTPDGSAGDSI